MAVDKICGTCGKAFSVKPYLAKQRQHCSQACRAQENRVRCQCEHCRKDFWKWKSQVAKQRGDGKFCSRACMVAAKRKLEPQPKPVFTPLLKVCEECGVTFRIPPSRENTARWCSRACQKQSPTFRKECSEAQQGEKHWRWSGGAYKKRATGYVRIKRKRNGKETVRWQHTAVMVEWMLEVDPSHPFLIVVDGLHRLHPDIEVHHIDRKRSNNVRENLLAVTRNAHAQIHHRGKKPEPWECWPSNPTRW